MRRLPFILLLLLTAPSYCLGQQTPQQKKARDLLSSALTQGDADKALDFVKQAILLDDEFVPAYYVRGQLYEKKNEMDKALDDYRQALELTYISRGKLEADNNRLEEAIQEFSSAIDVFKKFAPRGGAAKGADVAYRAFYHRGLAHASLPQPDYDQAIRDLGEAIKMYPGFAPAYYNKGLVESLKGDLDAAIADSNDAIKMQPDYVEAYQSLGHFYEKKGRWAQAADIYRRALEIKQGDPDLIESLGNALLEDGNAQAALPRLRGAFEAKPNDPEVMSNYGWALFKSNQRTDALRRLEAAREAVRDAGPESDQLSSSIHERLGRVYSEQGNKVKAIDSYNAALRFRNDRRQEALINEGLGEAYSGLGEMESAAAAYEAAAAALKALPDESDKPLKVSVYVGLGDAYGALKKTEPAKKSYDDALKLVDAKDSEQRDAVTKKLDALGKAAFGRDRTAHN